MDVISRRFLSSRSIHLFDIQKQVWTTWFTPEEGHVVWKSWSRDSGALYFATDKTGNKCYWRLGVGDQTPTKVADLPDEHLAPILAPDGSVLYTHDLSTYEIYALHLNEN